ncbi:MAG: hypothetical protein ACXVXP_00405 [Mycobacteriaceae bacterium]
MLAFASPAAAQNTYHTPQGVQAHPTTWVASRPDALTFDAVRAVQAAPATREMFDSISVSTVPAYATAVAGYTAGFWPTYLPLVQAFPQAEHISIAISARYHADCLDVEPGDAAPSQAAAWIRADIAAGFKKPCVYSSYWEYLHQVFPDIAANGIPRSAYWAWDANYTFVQHLDAGFDATQWTDRALGRNLDESTVTLAFLGAAPAPDPAPVNHHYAWFVAGPFPSKWGNLNERLVVERYDGARAHPAKYAGYLKNVLEPELVFLAARDAKVAGAGTAHPTWGQFHRGWRFQQLIHRAQGKLV